MLAEERLLAEGVSPRRYVGCATGVSQADELVLGEEGVLGLCQDDTEVAIMSPTAGTID